MDEYVSKMKKTTPFLWNFALSLLDMLTNQLLAIADPRAANKCIAPNREMDMGEIGEDGLVLIDVDNKHTGNRTGRDTHKESSTSSRNMALLVIVGTVVLWAQQTLNYAYRRESSSLVFCYRVKMGNAITYNQSWAFFITQCWFWRK